MKKYFILIASIIFSSVLIKTTFAEHLTIAINTTWDSGTYTYDNVLITNGATLTFNGTVTLNAQNLTIDSSSSICADGKGYPRTQGPGAGAGGGGYGGKGGGSGGGPTYGSAKTPTDLGSGGGNG